MSKKKNRYPFSGQKYVAKHERIKEETTTSLLKKYNTKKICCLLASVAVLGSVTCLATNNYITLKKLQNQNATLTHSVLTLNKSIELKNDELQKTKEEVEKQKEKIKKLEKQSKRKNALAQTELAKVKSIKNYIMDVNSTVKEKDATFMGECFIEAGKIYNLDPFLLAGIANAESSFYTNSVSRVGAVGLMQVHWPAHGENLIKSFKTINCRNDMFNPRNGILAGAYIYKCALDHYNGNHVKALNRYLSGDSPAYRKKIFTTQHLLAKGY